MSRQATLNSPVFSAGKIGLALLVLVLFAAPIVRGQDAIPPSLAGEEASEARRQSIDKIPYNLELGPMKLRFSATIGFEYNDNINLAEDATALLPSPTGPVLVTTRQQSDFIIRPQVNIDAL